MEASYFNYGAFFISITFSESIGRILIPKNYTSLRINTYKIWQLFRAKITCRTNHGRTDNPQAVVRSVLTLLGWNIHKLWGTEWWEAGDKQIQGVMEAIRAAEEGRKEPISTPEDTYVSFAKRETESEGFVLNKMASPIFHRLSYPDTAYCYIPLPLIMWSSVSAIHRHPHPTSQQYQKAFLKLAAGHLYTILKQCSYFYLPSPQAID